MDPIVRAKRALDYWHKHGKFPFDEPGYNPVTGLVRDLSKPKRKHRRTSTPTHQCTDAQAHTLPGPEVVVHLEHLKPSIPIQIHPSEGEEGSDVTCYRTPYHMIPIVQAEQEERVALGITPRDYGKRWRSAYRGEIGEMPECSPGEHDKAEMYWARICRALEMCEGERGCWTPSENNRLHLLERKWRARKDGDDPWFELKGTWKGRLTYEEREQFEEIKAMIDLRKRGRR